MDFNNDETIVWAHNCSLWTNTSMVVVPCSNPPLLLESEFYASNSSALWRSNYTWYNYDGYISQGQIYDTQVCVGKACKIMSVHAADSVKDDLLMYGQQGAYGIIGFGPFSPIWYTLADPETNQAVYSIALARLDKTQALKAP